MPSERTFVTELATAVGMAGDNDLGAVLLAPDCPPAFTNLPQERWEQLRDLFYSGRFAPEFRAGFCNGQAFLLAEDALSGRPPRRIEWTGGRRPPGDEVVPADLRIDHVYLVSCKYLSRILHNPSPARLVEGLLSASFPGDSRDWYERTAPTEYQELYEACLDELGGLGFPMLAVTLTREQRRELASRLREGWPPGAAAAYERLCMAVAKVTADEWAARLTPATREAVLWRLLRIGAVPYFVLGSGPSGSLRLRIDTPWDWRRGYRLLELAVRSQPGGQPRVGWTARYEEISTCEERTVSGHVEIRWSHGRFAQPPEAKVYLDTAHEDVPGYHPLEPRPAALAPSPAE